MQKNLIIIAIMVTIWTIPWKGLALWKSAKRGDKAWFIVLLLINTLAILEILYLFVFSREKKNAPAEKALDEKREITIINPKRFL